MAIEKQVQVDYAKQSLGQRDQAETYQGRGTLKVTTTKVQIIDHGLVVFEMDISDWAEIATMIR